MDYKYHWMNKSLLKGSLSTIILDLLARHGEMYGYEICKKAAEQSDEKIKITQGALYPQLHALEAQGVLQVREAKVGNRVRKYYQLTKSGKEVHQNALDEMIEYMSTINLILNLNPR